MLLETDTVASIIVGGSDTNVAIADLVREVVSKRTDMPGSLIDARSPELRQSPVATYQLVRDARLARATPVAIYSAHPQTLWEAIELHLGVEASPCSPAVIVGAAADKKGHCIGAALIGSASSGARSLELDWAGLVGTNESTWVAGVRAIFGLGQQG